MDIKKSWICSKPIAHRGLHGDSVPENSIAAFELAIERGLAIECDVRLIDDGTVVVFHDDRLGRLTDDDGYVSNLTATDLAAVRLSGTDQGIPTLREMLDFVKGRVPLLIEIKNRGKVGLLEQRMIDTLQGYDGDYAVISFNPYSLGFFREHAPNVPRGQLSTFFDKKDLPKFQRFVLKRLMLNRISQPHFICYEHSFLPNKYVAKTKLPVLAWTVRSHEEMARLEGIADNFIFELFDPFENGEDQ